MIDLKNKGFHKWRHSKRPHSYITVKRCLCLATFQYFI